VSSSKTEVTALGPKGGMFTLFTWLTQRRPSLPKSRPLFDVSLSTNIAPVILSSFLLVAA